MPEHIYSVRESWLNAALIIVREHLRQTAAIDVPQTVRVSCGFPGGGNARQRVGECWNAIASKDHMTELFISPVLDDVATVLHVLVHEAIHAALPNAGHKGAFKRAALAAGLVGKMTSTNAGDTLKLTLAKWADQLGIYPHGALSLANRKKQGTRLVKCQCPHCGYTVRTTAKWIEFSGPPYCSHDDGVQMEMA